MKHIIIVITLLAIVSLVACTIPSTTPAQISTSNTATVSPGTHTPPSTTPAQSAASNTATVSPVTRTTPTATPTQIATSYATEEAEIRDLVENFGKRLQNVSLQAPDAAQEIQKQYSEFVTPALLEMWMNDVSKAPGRIVSSPWPDRIEITTLSKESTDRYELTGFVVEITSLEVINGGAATKIPVRMVLQKVQGSWLITEYAEEQ